jgi:hypothetical protein
LIALWAGRRHGAEPGSAPSVGGETGEAEQRAA